MCGICGIINLDNQLASRTLLPAMMAAMIHRGPDDEGTFVDKNTALGFVRLSIIDLTDAGHQPMESIDGQFVLVFNGEIYNYIELREILRAKGYNFKSGTDTEVLLNAYIEWGSSCLERLNGMFAFAIYNRHSGDLFCARDRFGIKPFYYTTYNNQFIFASDIPPILTVFNEKPKANNQTIFDYLVYNRTNYNNQTFFKNILKLPHGHALKVTREGIQIYRWYDLSQKVKERADNNFNFRNGLTDSVRLQLRSDVPVGTCLSGGLDSSAITALVLKQNNSNELHSFSAVYGKGQKCDESSFIELFSDSRLKMHYTNPTAESLLHDLSCFIDALSEPVSNTSEYAEFKVMQLAKQHCTVILNGQGADEMMAGYHYFYGYYYKDLLKQFRLGDLFDESLQYYKLHKSIFGFKTFLFSLYPNLLNNFDTYGLHSDFINKVKNKKNPITVNFFSSKNLQEFLIKHFEYKFEHHLLWADKSGMYFSLETRFPFLDHNLVEQTLASGITIKNGYTKALMRDSLVGLVPEKIRLRTDKIGFSTPEENWFKTPGFQLLFQEVFNSKSFKDRGYFNDSLCTKQYTRFLNNKDSSKNLWKWLNLELWFRKYID